MIFIIIYPSFWSICRWLVSRFHDIFLVIPFFRNGNRNGATAVEISYFEHDPVGVLHEIRETHLVLVRFPALFLGQLSIRFLELVSVDTLNYFAKLNKLIF